MDSFGRKFKVSIFGESHGQAVGVLMDGVPVGMSLCEADFEEDVKRRAPKGAYMTSRRESDKPVFQSGILDGHTTGAPLCIIFRNENANSSDYSFLPAVPRPGHADYPAIKKFGADVDLRGGGRFSGRLTLPVVAAGVVAKKMLPPQIKIGAEVIRLGGSEDKSLWDTLLNDAASQGDSLGAVVECRAEGLRAGMGEPFWDSLESLISHAVFSIPGVRGIEFGDGFKASDMCGSRHNDLIGADGPLTDHAGGVNGGMSNGSPLVFRVAFKPTSSISKTQNTYDFAAGKTVELSLHGRHDVCFALRTPVIVEAVTAIVLADLL